MKKKKDKSIFGNIEFFNVASLVCLLNGYGKQK